LRLGMSLPLFAVHDVGLLLTAPPGSFTIGPRPLLDSLPLPTEARALLAGYRRLLESIADSEVMQKASSWRLRDEAISVLLGRILGEPYHRFTDRGKGVGAEALPLDPTIYQDITTSDVGGGGGTGRDDVGAGSDIARHFADFDSAPLFAFVRFLVDNRLE